LSIFATLTIGRRRHRTAHAYQRLKKRSAVVEWTCRQTQRNRSLIPQALAVFGPCFSSPPAEVLLVDADVLHKGQPGQWHFRNDLPADGLSLSSEIGRVGRPVAVRQNAAYLLAVVFFLRRRRPRSSLPFPALRRLAAVTAQRLLMSIAGSSSGDA
jgi:hypothetical protein